MGKLFDRIQDLTAPPPPMAMRAAYRKQEQRRQKLFVGEYSMHHPGDQHYTNNSRNPTDNGGGIVMMGTNPFRRTQRLQGVAGGKWTDGVVIATAGTGVGVRKEVYATNRTFSVPREDHTQFRNTTSAMVYSLAQHVQTNYIRTQQLQQSPPLTVGNASDHLLAVWGVAGEVCAVVIEGIRQETLIFVEDPQLFDTKGEEGTDSAPAQSAVIPIMTGILRDMMDWIEQEPWERRLVSQ
jgi:hypothetical protein